MKHAKVSPISLDEFSDIFSSAEDHHIDTDTVKHAGMWATRLTHPEYGDIVLISGNESGGLMIHS